MDKKTSSAFEYVKKQLSLKSKVVCDNETDTGFIVLSHDGMQFHFMHTCSFFTCILYCIGTLDVTCDACPCKFATTMQLPCRHMLAVREKKRPAIVYRGWHSKQMEDFVLAASV